MITDVSFLDWSIVVVFIVFLVYTTKTTQKYTQSVADFLSANRCAGRYLIGVSEGMAVVGAATIIAEVEFLTSTGFSSNPWYSFFVPIHVFVLLSGWVIYRYRATRALTLAQFFEMRYSRNFRLFSGVIAWVSGMLNFGIFPGIGARFFIMWFGLESHICSLGPLEIDLTLAGVMLVLIGLALFFTFVGGQIAVLVTDFWQGFLTGWVILALIAFVLTVIGWDRISEALLIASKPGESLVDPLDINANKDFNLGFYAIAWFFAIYQQGAWQGFQGYNTSALTPHEGKMGKVLGALRSQFLFYLVFAVIALTGITLFNHPDFSKEGSMVSDTLASLFSSESERRQLTSLAALRSLVPTGMVGLVAITLLGFFISTNNTLMHSWGSIFVQDILCPLRKTPLKQNAHLRWLRASIVCVAVLAFLISLLFPLKEYILMFMRITVTIFVGGAGVVLIGGLYWKRGTTLAAWCAMITGCSLSLATIILRTAWEHIPFCVERWGSEFPITSMVMAFFAAVAGCVTYVVVSLIDKQEPVNMDKLLHRGKYAVASEEEELRTHVGPGKPVAFLWKLIGVNSREFSRGDKVVFLWLFLANLFFFGLYVVLLILGWLDRMTPESWLFWYRFEITLDIVLAVIFLVWVSIGGLFDLRRLYKKLRTIERDPTDDGRVIGKSGQS